MNTYNIISYKVNKSIKPIDVLQELERLMCKNNANYSECFIKLEISIVEFEHDGKFHSNRNKNAILTILKRCPVLECFSNTKVLSMKMVLQENTWRFKILQKILLHYVAKWNIHLLRKL